MPKAIALATDFGSQAIYTGQIRALLVARNPEAPVIDLINDLPAFRPQCAAYLLAALVRYMPPEFIYLCVVDPGVGSQRRALVLCSDGRWFVGPDNGILAIVAKHAHNNRWWRISWQPTNLSKSFHGRDLFAPVVSMLVRGEQVPGEPIFESDVLGGEWPQDLSQVIYVDHFGNLITGIRASVIDVGSKIIINGQELARAQTFCEVPIGTAFWYVNSLGLVEIAVNQGRADEVVGVGVGDELTWRSP